jgi:transcriptional regulator with XRE-family HTH domain
MGFSIGDIVKQQRRQRGWDQAELARRLGRVGQQTVSRWELGTSRPRRNMVAQLAELFELDVADLLKAAGYVAPTADRPDEISRPVRPHVIDLPLAELSPERFEQLSAELAQLLHPNAKVHRVGGQGHKQHGFDVVVRDPDAGVTGIQCKREKQFGPADVRDAVDAVEDSVDDHLLLLTRPAASPEARKEIAKHDSWTLWDAEDISRVIRSQLPLDAAVRLVDTFFPGWREPFLGVREPGPWLTNDEFFQPFSGDQLYTHDWGLVGRGDELNSVLSFLNDENVKLAVLVGRGGIGKTRLLRSIAVDAEREHSITVRFVATGLSVRPENFELLPTDERLVVIIDDAHERTDIAELIAGINRTRRQAKVLLALRPYGMTQLASDLRRIGLHPTDFPTWELEDLTAAEAETLSREILGPGPDASVVQRLAQVSTDCPLIAVVGAGLIKRGQLDPQRLEADDSIRSEVLRAFRDALVADPATGDSVLRREVLDAAAVLQPVRTEVEGFRSAMKQLTDAPFDKITAQLRSLEDAGVLLRRGQSLRIVPDLLGDVILAQACFDERSGLATGYLDRAHQATDGEALQHVFVNASRVDWQVRQEHANATSLVESLWSAVDTEFRSAGIRARVAILRLLRKVAFFQPDRALLIARWAVEHPTEVVEEVDHVLVRLYRPSYEDVLHELPPLLNNIALNFGYLPQAADLLWQLGREDERPTNQHPEHAIRVLADLAGYQTGKPISFNAALVDTARRWLADENVGDLPRSPFDVLEPLLETEGYDQFPDAFKISFRPYTINVNAVRSLRDQVINLALTEARSQDLRRAVRAIKAVGSGLHYPMGLFGRSVQKAEYDKWTPIFVDAIQRLQEIATDDTLDPVVGIAIRQALDWHATHAPVETRAAALTVLEHLPSSLDHELALVLHDGWGHLIANREDFEQSERDKQARFERVAAELIANRSAPTIVGLLVDRLRAERRGFGTSEGFPGPFVWTLVGMEPSIGEAICQKVAAEPDSMLLELIPVTLSRLGDTRPSKAMDFAHKLLANGDLSVVQRVGYAFGWNRGARSQLLDGEIDLLRHFAEHKDPGVRSSAVRAAQMISKVQRVEAVELVTHVRFADSLTVATDLFSSFGPHGFLSWTELSDTQAAGLLNQLRKCPSIDEYHVTEFLSRLSRDRPTSVIKLLIERGQHSEQDGTDSDYRALPFQWHSPLQVRLHAQFGGFLRQIRDWIASNIDSWQRRTMGAELFHAVAGEFDEPVMEILNEAIRIGSREQIEALGAILREAPPILVWEDVDFVRRVLSAAAAHGEDCLQAIGGALHASVISGIRSGTSGQPFSEDIDQRNKSAEIARTLIRGSVEERFYSSLQSSAEQSIRWSEVRDERLLDGRDW